MAKKYRKGDAVAVLTSWDDKGTVQIRRATVHSCGRKVMRLIDARTGELFGTEYRPENPEIHAHGSHVISDAADANLEQIALADGAAVVAQERDRMVRQIAQNAANAHYVFAMRRHLNELHEPRVIW